MFVWTSPVRDTWYYTSVQLGPDTRRWRHGWAELAVASVKCYPIETVKI